MLRTLFVILIISVLLTGCDTRNPICSENFCVTGEIFPKSELGNRDFDELPATLSEQQLLSLFSENPNNQVKHLPTDPDDVFYINGVVDYVAPQGDAVLMRVRVRNEDFSSFDGDDLSIWVTAFDTPELLKPVKKGKRYTFKVEIFDADRDISRIRGIFYDYDIWTNLIEIQ